MAQTLEMDPVTRLKAQAALAALHGDRSPSELAAEFGFEADEIAHWKERLERGAVPFYSVDVSAVAQRTAARAPRKVLGSICIASLFFSWRERRHAASISRRLLKAYHDAAAAQPRLPKRVLYRSIVINYLKCTPAAADQILKSAEDSFTAWPIERALTFQDVVHYLAVSSSGWTQQNLGRIVASVVPIDL
jgi:hypothetical protein